MLPAALLSGVLLPLSGIAYDKVGPKPTVAIGLLLMAYGTWLMHTLDANTPISTIIIWMSIRSFGMGMSMMPIQTALMSALAKKDIGRGSAISNIISRVSSSFGLAILTTIVTNRTTWHASQIAWNVTSQSIAGYAASANISNAAASATLQGAISSAAFISSIQDIFIITAILTLIAFFLTFMLKASTGKSEEMIVEM